MIIGKIKNIRKSRKIPQEEIAKRIGMKTNTYRDLENSVSRLRLDDFLKLCEILEINPLTLIKNSNDTIIILDENEIKLFEGINNQIKEQKKLNEINIADNRETIDNNHK